MELIFFRQKVLMNLSKIIFYVNICHKKEIIKMVTRIQKIKWLLHNYKLRQYYI